MNICVTFEVRVKDNLTTELHPTPEYQTNSVDTLGQRSMLTAKRKLEKLVLMMKQGAMI